MTLLVFYDKLIENYQSMEKIRSFIQLVLSFFPIQVETLEAFARTVKERNGEAVTITAVLRAPGRNSLLPENIIGGLDLFYYVLVCTSKTSGRPIAYEKKCFERFGIEYGFGDSTELDRASIELILHGERLLHEIKKSFPELHPTLVSSEGEPFGVSEFEKLHKDASRLRVAV